LVGLVPEDEEVIVSTNKGYPIAMDNNSITSKAFHNIASRLQGEEVEFISFNEKSDIFTKLSKMLRSGGE